MFWTSKPIMLWHIPSSLFVTKFTFVDFLDGVARVNKNDAFIGIMKSKFYVTWHDRNAFQTYDGKIYWSSDHAAWTLTLMTSIQFLLESVAPAGGGRGGHGHPDIFVGPPTGPPTTPTASSVTYAQEFLIFNNKYTASESLDLSFQRSYCSPSLSHCYHGNTLILARTTLWDSHRQQQVAAKSFFLLTGLELTKIHQTSRR